MYLPDDKEFDKTLNAILTPFSPKTPNLILTNISGYMVHVTHSGCPMTNKLFSMCVWVGWISSTHIFTVSTCKNTKIHNFDDESQFPAFFKTMPLMETHSPNMHLTSILQPYTTSSCKHWHHWMKACYAHHNVLLTLGLVTALHCGSALAAIDWKNLEHVAAECTLQTAMCKLVT